MFGRELEYSPPLARSLRKRQARLYVMFWKSGCAIVRFRMRGFVDLLACEDRVWANVNVRFLVLLPRRAGCS